jgi:HPt (histidine-containing phosphotransfer) domain-containing protein
MNPQHLAGELHKPDPTLNMPSTPMAPAPPETPAVQLDADAVARLRELDPEGRHGVVERVLKAFESSLLRMLGQLEAQLERGDAAVVSGVAHTLRSSAASVGALALAQTCAQVESRLRTDGPVSLGGDIERLLHDGGAALVAVRAMLRQ